MPDYVPTDWVDNVTPVDETRMDHLEAGVDGAVQMDSELAAAVRLVANKLLAADANQAFRIRGDGRIEWGAGGATALDVALYRAGADLLATDDRLVVIRANDLDIALTTQKVGDAQSKFRAYANGRLEWGPGNAATDIILTRVSADILELQGDTLWVAGLKGPVKAGIPVDGDVPGGAANGNMVIDTTNSRLYFRIGGVWHYCAINDGAGASGGVDYKGAWSSVTAYAQGDVVLYNGVEYIAVNPGTNQTPPAAVVPAMPVIGMGTALPTTGLFDGMEFILVDSVVAPTYSWRFRYVAAKATNKWIFVGGSAAWAGVETPEAMPTGSYGDCATVGPAIAIPVAGSYEIAIGQTADHTPSGAYAYMSYAIGATAAAAADELRPWAATGEVTVSSRTKVKTFTAVTITAKYFSAVATTTSKRWMRIQPVAVGG